ncbi:membrane protein insertion efficiency factor YidD [Kocuria rhizophila]|nr:membrane protein insertion efficiency factor YidD [Kocuria rhizophila]
MVCSARSAGPQNLLIALLKLYRTIVSPLTGRVPADLPCSAYALEAVTVHGAVRGLGLSVMRLLHATPGPPGRISRGGWSPRSSPRPQNRSCYSLNLGARATRTTVQARHHAG